MKTLHYLLLGLAILTFSKTNGQDFKGIWISTQKRELRPVNEREVLQDNEFVSIKLDSTEIDTYYYEAYMLLDFIDDENVIVKGLFDRQEKCKYAVENNNLEIKVKRYELKGQISENSIVLVDKNIKSVSKETFFERLNDSKIKDKTGLDSISFINSNWVVDTDTLSHNYGLNFHFLDSAIAIINQDYGDVGYTNWGEWKIDCYKNHLFLGVTDRNILEPKFYHFFDRAGNTLIGNTYEFYPFPTEPPQLKAIKLIKQELLDSTQLKTLEADLIGKWIATNNPLSIDTSFQDFYKVDTILNQKFEIVFNDDKTFRLEKSGTIVKRTDKIHKLDTLTGDWEISKTGKYIVIKPVNSWIRYLTIKKLESDYLEIFCEFEALYDEHMMSNKTIKMKK